MRAAEALIRETAGAKTGATPAATKAAKDPNVQSLEQSLSDRLGANVAIRHSQKGKGTLVIHYGSLDELDGILEHIK